MLFVQNVLRVSFYLLSAYAVYLICLLYKKKRKEFKKGVKDITMYIIISITLLILLGNIIIFNIDMFNAILGNMSIHTVIYLLILIGAYIASIFLHRYIKSL